MHNQKDETRSQKSMMHDLKSERRTTGKVEKNHVGYYMITHLQQPAPFWSSSGNGGCGCAFWTECTTLIFVGAYWEKGTGEVLRGIRTDAFSSLRRVEGVLANRVSSSLSCRSSAGRPNSSMGINSSLSRGGRYFEWSKPKVPGAW